MVFEVCLQFLAEWPVLYLVFNSRRLVILLFRFKEVAKLLIESGADVNIQANNGCRAFDIGSIIGERKIKGIFGPEAIIA